MLFKKVFVTLASGIIITSISYANVTSNNKVVPITFDSYTSGLPSINYSVSFTYGNISYQDSNGVWRNRALIAAGSICYLAGSPVEALSGSKVEVSCMTNNGTGVFESYSATTANSNRVYSCQYNAEPVNSFISCKLNKPNAK